MLLEFLIPAVSIKLQAIPFIIVVPSMVSLVVPSMSVTMAFSSSRIAFKRLLFPTFGFPIIPMVIPSLIIFPSSLEAIKLSISCISSFILGYICSFVTLFIY